MPHADRALSRLDPILRLLRGVFAPLTAAGRRRRRDLRRWQKKWSKPDFADAWLGRGVSPEIVAAIEEGWFDAGGWALDIGCGEGEVAAWLAEKGFSVVGVDIAPAAIERARARFGRRPGRLEFFALDICAGPPPKRDYRILIDRGCLHQIPPADVPAYLKNLLEASAADARMLLFVRAFRGGQTPGDPEERRRVTDEVEAALGRGFEMRRAEATDLGAPDGRPDRPSLPGMVFWMIRRPHESEARPRR
jgi:SAM-dependent methyltransferase